VASRIDTSRDLLHKAVRRTAVHVGSPVYASYRRRRAVQRPPVLVFTDSRGTNVTGPLGKSVFNTYVSRLMRTHRVYPVILPRRHTTLLDFLNYRAQDSRPYAAIVLHCGIVDFSPRPVSSVAPIVAAKSGEPGYAQMFSESADYHRAPSGAPYRGEPTTTLYSIGYLRDTLLPRLSAIHNLLWVTTNDFVPGWEGSYTRGRPADIQDRITEFESVMRPAMSHVVDLHAWSHDEVKRYTVDNVHLSTQGADELAARVGEWLDRRLRAGSS
jgi:hypothetical protein